MKAILSRMQPKRTYLILLLFFSLSNVQANDENAMYSDEMSSLQPRANSKIDRMRIALSPEVMSLSLRGETLTAIGLSARYSYALDPKLDVGLGVHQAFVDFTPFFTALDISVTYAVTGSFVRFDESHYLGDSEVVHSRGDNLGGIRAQLLLSQYFFSTSAYVLSFSGFGGSVFYDFPSRNLYNFQLGVRADLIANGGVSLIPIRLFGSIAFWL